jgi:hypothetical protein
LIALLFGLLAVAMILAWRNRVRYASALFALAVLLGIYWFKFHATSQLTIQL